MIERTESEDASLGLHYLPKARSSLFSNPLPSSKHYWLESRKLGVVNARRNGGCWVTDHWLPNIHSSWFYDPRSLLPEGSLKTPAHSHQQHSLALIRWLPTHPSMLSSVWPNLPSRRIVGSVWALVRMHIVSGNSAKNREGQCAIPWVTGRDRR